MITSCSSPNIPISNITNKIKLRFHSTESQIDHESGISTALFPKPGECGKFDPSEKSPYGNAKLGEYPWTAQLAYLRTNIFPIRFEFTCNGVLINVNHVMAPAYCVEADKNP